MTFVFFIIQREFVREAISRESSCSSIRIFSYGPIRKGLVSKSPPDIYREYVLTVKLFWLEW